MSHSGLFKLKFIGVGCSVSSICTEFLSDRRQGVVDDGAASEWIPIISGVPRWYMCSIYQRNVWTGWLFAYADDSTLLAVVRKLGDRSSVAASLNGDLARIQEWCNLWYMIMNHNKTKVFVLSRSRTLSPPHGDLVLSCVSIRASPNFDILGVKFDSKLLFELFLFNVSLRELVFWGWWKLYLSTPLCYFVAILHLFSQSLSIVLRCGGQLLNVTFCFLSAQVYSVPIRSQAWFQALSR